MRSPPEIAFRLRQEMENLAHLVFRRRAVPDLRPPLGKLPPGSEVAEALRGTAYARKVQRLARLILAHRFPVLGYTIATGPDIDWSKDYVHGKTAPRRYFRLIPYLDFAAVGDHKVIWELNRHQHWVVLAQAHLLIGEQKFLDEIWRQFRSWTAANPYLRGMNWTSALEVAFRALSWMWVYHLAGEWMPEAVRREFLIQLYRHGLYLESNLSVYFSPNTHLLGEAVALHALGVLFPNFPKARRWERTGARIVREQADFQVRDDGSHFERSTYYHVYALDLLLFHLCLAAEPAQLRAKVGKMAEYLEAMAGSDGRIPLIGDDDGGRVFHPYGPRDRFGRATLATAAALLGDSFDREEGAVQAAWWLGPRVVSAPARPETRASRLFRDAGLAVMISGTLQVVVDVGTFGFGNGGHSHSDALSIVARDGAEDILVDPGTYTYVGDPRRRDWFRGSAAHNTVRVDQRDQATTAGSFRWMGKPRVDVEQWLSRDDLDYVEAVCRSDGVLHRRHVLFLKEGERLLVVDTIEAPAGEHLIEQFWHLGEPACQVAPGRFRIGSRAMLTLAGAAQSEFGRGGEHGWRSRVFGAKAVAPVVRVWTRTSTLLHLAAMLNFREGALELIETAGVLELRFDAGRVRLSQGRPPEVGQL